LRQFAARCGGLTLHWRASFAGDVGEGTHFGGPDPILEPKAMQ
jgi:hypothetical protein